MKTDRFTKSIHAEEPIRNIPGIGDAHNDWRQPIELPINEPLFFAKGIQPVKRFGWIKNFLLSFLLLFTVLQGVACMCESEESNFYNNLRPDKTVVLVVMEDLSIGNEYDERIEMGHFRLLHLTYDSGNFPVTDTMVVAGNNGRNCGEYFSNFNLGDSLFLIISTNWGEDETQLFLEGCDVNYLKVKNGKCKGLPLTDVIQKIDYSVGQNMSCGCGSLEWVFDFYSNVKKPYSFCFASFIRYDYRVRLNNQIFQTGYFRVLDTIRNISLPVNSEIVVLGENGINCGEMFENYRSGDSLILALDASPLNKLSTDTFLLNGVYCGSHVLKIKNGVDKQGMTYAAVKAKMHSIITNDPFFQTKESCLVYPNPFCTAIHISSLNHPILRVKLFDINGRLILKEEGFNMQEKEFSPGPIPNGIYQLEIETTNGYYHKRVVKMN